MCEAKNSIKQWFFCLKVFQFVGRVETRHGEEQYGEFTVSIIKVKVGLVICSSVIPYLSIVLAKNNKIMSMFALFSRLF